MNRNDVLEKELVWDEDGHLSDIAKSAFADGQDILPPDAVSHFAGCHECIESVGKAALLSAELSAALSPERAAQRAMPWIPIGIALAVAALSALPMLTGARLWLSTLGLFLVRGLRLAGHGIVTLGTNGLAPTVSLASTALLVAMGFAIARLVPRTAVQ
jgi:hypothetical protein